MRRRVIEAVLNDILGLNSKLKAAVQSVHKVTGRKKKKKKSGGLHEKHVVATWNVGNRLSICL